jgi:transcriptional regulator with XRE-family HTH domain
MLAFLTMASFAQRLDELFRTVRSPVSGKLYSVRQAATACGLSHTHLNKLRSGQSSDPRMSEVEALARFFGVPVDRLAGLDEPPGDVEREVLEAALRQPGVHQVALRMVDRQLSPEGAAAVLRIVDEVARLEEAQRRRAGSAG